MKERTVICFFVVEILQLNSLLSFNSYVVIFIFFFCSRVSSFPFSKIQYIRTTLNNFFQKEKKKKSLWKDKITVFPHRFVFFFTQHTKERKNTPKRLVKNNVTKPLLLLTKMASNITSLPHNRCSPSQHH